MRSKQQGKRFPQSTVRQICGQQSQYSCLFSTRAALHSRARYARMGGQTGSTTPLHIYSATVNEWINGRQAACTCLLQQLTSPAPTRTSIAEYRWFD
jgi:hypothetical protein